MEDVIEEREGKRKRRYKRRKRGRKKGRYRKSVSPNGGEREVEE